VRARLAPGLARPSLKPGGLGCRSKLRSVSFRGRLILFFVLIVALPMVAVAVLVSDVTGSSATGKADAALNADLDVALALNDELVADAAAEAKQIAADPRFSAAVAAGDQAAIESAASTLANEHRVESLQLISPSGSNLVQIGERDPIAVASIELVQSPGGETAGKLRVSTSTVSGYLAGVRQRTGEQALLVGADGVSGPVSVDASEIPAGGDAEDVDIDGKDQRVASEELPDSGGRRVALIGPTISGGFFASRPNVAVAVVLFFLIALIAVGFLTRSLQGQIANMLAAARRIGEGDFSQKVPVEGRDELAGLASEFNKMSDRLTAQMDELRRQQLELEGSVERIGQAFASGLDRVALLGILIETAVSACEADYGLVALSGSVGAEAESGDASEALSDAALAAEHQAVRSGGVAEAQSDGAYALASSLGKLAPDDAPVGAMTVARMERPFSASERRVFLYLVGQAAASVENIALHELVSEQAVTDELTGLPNHRAFREAMAKEAARAQRFRHDLSLLILDIDDFKQVNDTHGHLQGDAVLRAVGRIVDDESREIDEPARYGGEEFVVALPETSLEGALEVGERIRSRIERQAIRLVQGPGKLTVTASLGAATMDSSNDDVNTLIAAADEALYEAKRTGKNRVVAADGRPARTPAKRAAGGRLQAKGRAPARRK
jgi:diguanylate cyclase (GGDEF)-like protein